MPPGAKDGSLSPPRISGGILAHSFDGFECRRRSLSDVSATNIQAVIPWAAQIPGAPAPLPDSCSVRSLPDVETQVMQTSTRRTSAGRIRPATGQHERRRGWRTAVKHAADDWIAPQKIPVRCWPAPSMHPTFAEVREAGVRHRRYPLPL